MMMDDQSIDIQFDQVVRLPIRQVITYSLYLLCIVSVALAGVACTIANDDEDVVETPPIGFHKITCKVECDQYG